MEEGPRSATSASSAVPPTLGERPVTPNTGTQTNQMDSTKFQSTMKEVEMNSHDSPGKPSCNERKSGQQDDVLAGGIQTRYKVLVHYIKKGGPDEEEEDTPGTSWAGEK